MASWSMTFILVSLLAGCHPSFDTFDECKDTAQVIAGKSSYILKDQSSVFSVINEKIVLTCYRRDSGTSYMKKTMIEKSKDQDKEPKKVDDFFTPDLVQEHPTPSTKEKMPWEDDYSVQPQDVKKTYVPESHSDHSPEVPTAGEKPQKNRSWRDIEAQIQAEIQAEQEHVGGGRGGQGGAGVDDISTYHQQ